jgi:hypothetical protein
MYVGVFVVIGSKGVGASSRSAGRQDRKPDSRSARFRAWSTLQEIAPDLLGR